AATGRRERPHRPIAALAVPPSIAAGADPGDAHAADAGHPADAERPDAPQPQQRAAAAGAEHEGAPAPDPAAGQTVLDEGEVEYRSPRALLAVVLEPRPCPRTTAALLTVPGVAGGALEERAGAPVAAATACVAHPVFRVGGCRAPHGPRGCVAVQVRARRRRRRHRCRCCCCCCCPGRYS
ncbi:unnamed protein product, partial [Ectocarpus sp. 12 AP-2014]